MEAFIHIGSPKAGSSYLQTVCARARMELANHGILFAPGNKYDERFMREGRVSAGNARELARAINSDDWAWVERWAQQLVAKARKMKCSSVLVSSEWLLGALSSSNRLMKLEKCMAKAGISQV